MVVRFVLIVVTGTVVLIVVTGTGAVVVVNNYLTGAGAVYVKFIDFYGSDCKTLGLEFTLKGSNDC